jgi:hypothetical protein
MSEYTIFGFGVIAGVAWCVCSALAALWFYRIKAVQSQRYDETGTDAHYGRVAAE